MRKTKTKKTAKQASGSLQPDCSTRTLPNCYLEHAARETEWAAEHSRQCNYQSAANALERRGVWLMAALIAQERKAQNAELSDSHPL